MKTKFISQKFKYDGSQLKPLTNYLKHQILGDSCIAWVGPCEIPFEHMMDGEDLNEKSIISSNEMLHFIFEIFDRELVSGVFLQRLFAGILQNWIYKKFGFFLERSGDDLYLEKKKFSISIATRSSNSVLVHFAVNVTNQGTPVPTCSCEDLKIDPVVLGNDMLEMIQQEYRSILQASYKVRTF